MSGREEAPTSGDGVGASSPVSADPTREQPNPRFEYRIVDKNGSPSLMGSSFVKLDDPDVAYSCSVWLSWRWPSSAPFRVERRAWRDDDEWSTVE